MTIRTPRTPAHRRDDADGAGRADREARPDDEHGTHDTDAGLPQHDTHDTDAGLPHHGTAGLGARAARGAAVTLGAQGGKVLVQVASVVVLARLLSPHDYGLIAMVVAIIGVGELFRDFGLSSASIQAATVTRGQRTNLFWVNAAIGAVLTAAVFGGAGVIALAFGQPDLVPIAHALAFTFLINGLGTQYRADLVRRMRFTAVAAADVIAPAVALAVAIATALAGWGYWALVAQQLTQALTLLAVLVVAAGWLPGLPRRDAPIGAFIAFGWNMLASQLVSYVSNNIDNVLVGVKFGAASLGVYSRAFQLLMTPLNQVRIPLTTVALPVFSRLQNEKERFGEWLCRGQLALGYTIVAGLALVAGASDPLTALLLGPQWHEAAPILRFFAIAGIFQILAFVGYWAYVSRGLTKALLHYSLVSAGIKIVCIGIGSFGGVLGIAIAYAVAPAISWPISLAWLAWKTEVPTARLYSGAGRVLACAALAAAAAWGACTTAAALCSVAQVAAAVVALALVYGAAVLLIPAIRRDLSGVLAAARLVRSR